MIPYSALHCLLDLGIGLTTADPGEEVEISELAGPSDGFLVHVVYEGGRAENALLELILRDCADPNGIAFIEADSIPDDMPF